MVEIQDERNESARPRDADQMGGFAKGLAVIEACGQGRQARYAG